jgi:isoleucyl-tRNA synthetase
VSNLMSVDYKSTVFLPKTDFPMKGRLPDLEPKLLERWKEMSLYDALRKQSEGREKFVLHDGPPYANGHLHIGHALNKILKDVINRSQQMQGKDANYVPGWDCHGLPIEWKIEEKYRAEGKDKDQVPINEFRKECRQFADHWIDIQREEFKRLGVLGNWADPYTTMAFKAEAQIVRELGKFLMNGGLYRGSKAVMWSPVEKTALAEAEVEYHDHKSTTIHVRFPVVTASIPEVEGAAIVIWTTTPWTMPANRAVAYGADLDYVVLQVTGVEEESLAVEGEKLIVARALVEQV